MKCPNLRSIGLVLLVLVCALSSVSQAAETPWPNEPAGSSVVFDCPFTGDLCGGMWNAYPGSPAFANDGTAPVSPSGVIDHNLPAGAETGGGQYGIKWPTSREAYNAIWWKTNAEFVGYPGGNNKMIFQIGNSSDGGFHNQWILMWDLDHIWLLSQTTDEYNCHLPNSVCQSGSAEYPHPLGWSGVNLRTPNIQTTRVPPGSGWHRIEFYVKSSTTGSSKNGILKLWVDGVLNYHYTNINIHHLGVAEWQFNTTWDGQQAAQCGFRQCSLSWHHYYDHLHISLPNTASSIKDIPLGAPAPPSGVRATVQ